MHQVVIFGTVCIAAFCALGYLKRGGYWRKQPVMRHSLFTHKEGQIKNPKDVDTDSLKLTQGESWVVVGTDVLRRFLNENYTSTYNEDYLKWILSCPGKAEGCSIGLLNSDGELIGTITGRPISMYLKGNIKRGFYVDFLCVRNDLRTRGYAPHLINRLIKTWKDRDLEICVFYKDTKPLPIEAICELSYWGAMAPAADQMRGLTVKKYEKQGYKIFPLSNQTVDQALIFLSNHLVKYRVHQDLSKQQFVHLFMPKKGLVYTYLLFHRNELIGFSNFVIESDDRKTSRIVYHITKSRSKDHAIVHDNLLMTKLSRRKLNCIYMLDLPCHRSLIRTTKASRLDRTYYHLYNYFVNVNAKEVGFTPS